MIKKLETDFEHIDGRGLICQILSIPNSQVNYLFTKKGAKRGNHYHKRNREFFYVISGKVQISAFYVKNPEQTELLTFSTGNLFVVEPYVMHDFTFIDDTQMVVIYDIGVEANSEKDIYTE